MSRPVYISVFLTVFSVIVALGNYYIFDHIVDAFALDAGGRSIMAILLGVLSFSTLLAMPLTRSIPREKAAPLAWLAFSWMGMLLLLFTTFLISDILWVLVSILHNTENPALLHQQINVIAFVVALVLTVIALWNGLRPVRVKPVTIRIDKLPPSFDGLRLVQITDLHIGPLIDGAWLSHIVDHVNALNPDIIALTGDLIDGSVADLGKHVASLAKLKARYGVYFITGNHEYYSGANAWCAHVASLGLTVLRNARVKVTHADGASFDLAGVDDWKGGAFGQGPDLPKALAGRDSNDALILLAHQPAAIVEAAQHHVDLQLSGHTHGGQIWPFNYLVYLQQPYAQGLRRYKGTTTQIYTSPGTGFWGPPMRLGTRAEITSITLRALSGV